MSINAFDTASIGGAGFAGLAPQTDTSSASAGAAGLSAGTADFQATLDEIKKKGFLGYIQDEQKEKLAEMRKNILQSMGLTEDQLAKMAPQQRAAIEKTIDTEIQQRLAAEQELDKNGKPKSKNDASDTMVAATAPNGLGTGATLIQAMEAASKPDSDSDADDLV